MNGPSIISLTDHQPVHEDHAVAPWFIARSVADVNPHMLLSTRYIVQLELGVSICEEVVQLHVCQVESGLSFDIIMESSPVLTLNYPSFECCHKHISSELGGWELVRVSSSNQDRNEDCET